MKQLWAATAIALAAATTVPAHAAIKVDGMPLIQTAPANGVPLLINGAGTVTMGGKRMAAAVYLAENSTSSSSIMTMPGAKSLRLTALSNMPASNVAKSIEAGVKKNVSADTYKGFKPALDAFSKQLAEAKTVAKGQTVEFLYEPSNGIVLMGPGAHIIPATGSGELFQAILRSLPAGVLSSSSVQKRNKS